MKNILISFFAQSQNVQRVVAKVNRSELASMAEKLGLNTIVSPKKAVSNVVTSYARALQNTLGSNVETMYKLMDGSVEALEFNVKSDSSVIGIPFKNIKLKHNVLIAGITRGRSTIIPSGNDMIMSGDRVIVISAEQRLHDLDDILL